MSSSDSPDLAEAGVRPRPDWNPDKSLLVARVAALRAVDLVSMFFDRIDGEPLSDWDGDCSELDDELEFSTTGLHVVDLDSDPVRLGCMFRFEASFPAHGDDDPGARGGPFFLGASYRVTYELREHEGIEADAFETYAYWNGLLTLWPYWRELVQSTTSRAGIDVTVPIFRLPAS